MTVPIAHTPGSKNVTTVRVCRPFHAPERGPGRARGRVAETRERPERRERVLTQWGVPPYTNNIREARETLARRESETLSRARERPCPGPPAYAPLLAALPRCLGRATSID